MKALQKLDGKRPIRFSLAGNISERIIEEIRMGLPKVEIVYHGYLDHSAAIALMKSAHLLLNFIFDGANTQMISGKLLEYMASQRPVLSLGDPNSEAAKFINKGSCAVMFDSNDLEGITFFINRIIEQKETLFNEFPEIEKWSRESLTKALIKKCLD
jgi:glycosyltransferase involved in cell wall biosynthesis